MPGVLAAGAAPARPTRGFIYLAELRRAQGKGTRECSGMQRRCEQPCLWSFLRTARLAAERKGEGRRGAEREGGAGSASPRAGPAAPLSCRCPWVPVYPCLPPASWDILCAAGSGDGEHRPKLVPEVPNRLLGTRRRCPRQARTPGSRPGTSATLRHRLPGRCPEAGRRLARSTATIQSSSWSLISAVRAELRSLGVCEGEEMPAAPVLSPWPLSCQGPAGSQSLSTGVNDQAEPKLLNCAAVWASLSSLLSFWLSLFLSLPLIFHKQTARQ